MMNQLEDQKDDPMTILLVGGGSGGHITPVLAVAEALKQQRPDARLVYVIGKGDQLADIPRQHAAIDEVVSVRSGKWRRYHGEGLKQLLDVKTLLKNIRDAFYVLIGLGQSWRILRKYRPDVIFVKGGFVGMPVGLVAGWLQVPYVTHDSDAVPGLANRLIAKRAAKHAVAMPVEAYNYPEDKTIRVGVPVDKAFAMPSPKQVETWRAELNIPVNAPVICLTGGGNGSELLNNALIKARPQLMGAEPNLITLHVAGRLHENIVKTAYGNVESVKVVGFTPELYKYTGIADVVVTRAGATILADLAQQHRACVVIPNPLLTGGHQLKNAKVLEAEQAIKVVEEAQLRAEPTTLSDAIIDLLHSPEKRAALAAKLGAQARPNAAADLASLILSVTENQESPRGT
jgi:UDP-N-acetylglucosamine--N-acetylmuramyl-(pentapeptide) pyrophosphoryl-undecaprenol N-acetylglucosamine transferase